MRDALLDFLFLLGALALAAVVAAVGLLLGVLSFALGIAARAGGFALVLAARASCWALALALWFALARFGGYSDAAPPVSFFFVVGWSLALLQALFTFPEKNPLGRFVVNEIAERATRAADKAGRS